MSMIQTAVSKPSKTKFITFENFVKYGVDVAEKENIELIDGHNWSFNFEGHPITHENNECYIILTKTGTANFTPKDVLMIREDEIYPCPLDVFEEKYDIVSKEETFVDRLNIEHKELLDKADKLASFIDTKTFKNLSEEHQELLEAQLGVMISYQRILNIRIKKIGEVK